jgi:hypothetical protein
LIAATEFQQETGHPLVGRGAALAKLGRAWLGSEEAPIALVVGPAGIGKTAFAAEALHLWFDRFDYVLAFPALGGALRVEEILQQAHQRLMQASVAYRERCAENELAAVYLPATPSLSRDAREEVIRNNLVDTLAAEHVLLVIDGLDVALLSAATTNGHEAQDPAWDRLLETLADRLRDTGSRVLVTSRLAPSALHGARSVSIALGLLPPAEAAVFFDADRVLRTLRRGGDPDGLFASLTEAGRGHPFVLARFAALAHNHLLQDGSLSPAGSVALERAARLLGEDGYDALPKLCADPRGEVIAAGLVDLLIKTLPPESCRLLWALAQGPDAWPLASIELSWRMAGALTDLGAALTSLRAGGLVRDRGNGMLANGRLVAARVAAWMCRHPEALIGWPARWTPDV